MSRMCFNCMQMTEDGDFCAFCGKKLKTAPAHHLLPGTVLNGKYTVGYALGEGGFGVTYIGLDNSLQIKVAIKEFFPKGIVGRNSAVSSDVSCLNASESDKLFAAEKAKVINEARILAKFSKERGIVNVREYFEANNTAYIVMEYLEGETLEEYLAHSGPLSADQAFAFLLPVMKVLGKLHKEDVVHRDVSPDNLMFDGDQIKLLDFGAAREVLYSTSKSFSVILKHGYAPEEQYRRKGRQGAWTDVYSLCATLYYCITNVIPDTALDRMHEDDLKRPSDLGISITEQQENALLRGLSVLPEDRLQTVADFISAWNGEFVTMPNPQRETVAAYDKNESSTADKDKKTTTSGSETIYGGQAGNVSVDSEERNVYPDRNRTDTNEAISTPKAKRKGWLFALIGILAAVVVVGVLIFALLLGGNNKDNSTDNTGTTGTTPSDTQTQASTTETVDKYKKHLDRSDELLAEKKYDEAIAELETAEQLYGAHFNITAKKKEIKKEKGLNDLDTLEAEEKYKEGIEYIDKNLSEYKSDSDILGKRNLYVSKYKTQIIAAADETLNTEGYEAAMNLIQEALKVLPGDQELTTKQDEYLLYKPVDLFSLEYFNAHETFRVDGPQDETDNLGESHVNSYVFDTHYSTGKTWVTYKIDGNYSLMKGTFFLDNYYKTTTDEIGFYVYGDDKLLHKGTITGGEVPKDFSIDITGVQLLKIEYYTRLWTGDWSMPRSAGIFCDTTIQK